MNLNYEIIGQLNFWTQVYSLTKVFNNGVFIHQAMVAGVRKWRKSQTKLRY